METIWKFVGGIVALYIGLIIISLPFQGIYYLYIYAVDGALSNDINKYKEPILEKWNEISSYMNIHIDEATSGLSKIFIEFPVSTLIVVILILVILNKLILKRKGNLDFFESFVKSLFLFFFIGYLLYALVNYESNQYQNISKFLSVFSTNLMNFIYSTDIEKKIIFNRMDLLLLLYISVAYWINTRLIWIVSIALFQISLIYINYESIIVWITINQFPEKYYRIVQGIIPLIILAPYVLTVWIYRDNDKYFDYSQKERDLDVKEKERKIKEDELKTKNNELSIRREEFKLKEKEFKLKKKEFELKQEEFEFSKIEDK